MNLLETPFKECYAVIFTSLKTEEANTPDYGQTNDHLESIAKHLDGFIGMESVRENIGISISYWKDMASIRAWQQQMDHMAAKAKGKSLWYSEYTIRICKVEYQHHFKK